MTAVATIVALPDAQPCIARENHGGTPEPKKREMEQASPAREGGELKLVVRIQEYEVFSPLMT